MRSHVKAYGVVPYLIKDNDIKILLCRSVASKNKWGCLKGTLNKNESAYECAKRELFEETGLSVKKINKILPPSFAAVAISDTMTQIAFVEADGEFEDHTSENELIEAAFYSKEEIRQMLETEQFSSRAQVIAYFFACH